MLKSQYIPVILNKIQELDWKRRGALRVFLESFSFLLLILLDPFGLSAITSIASQNMFDRLHAIITPANESDRIAIVLVDLKTLNDANETWPPSFNLWSNLLTSISEYDPLAIFVDVYFGVDRSKSKESDLAALVKHDIPASPRIFLADHGQNALRRSLLDGDCLEWSPDTAYPSSGHQIPSPKCQPSALFPRLRDAAGDRRTYIDWPLRDDRRLYPLHTLHSIPMNQAGDVLSIASSLPATALAREVCRETPGRPAGPAWCKENSQFLTPPTEWVAPRISRQDTIKKAIEEKFDRALLPRWSFYSSPKSESLIEDFKKTGCIVQKSDFIGKKIIQSIGILPITAFPRIFDTPYFRNMFFLPAFSNSGPEHLDENGMFAQGISCPHIVTIHASDIIMPTNIKSSNSLQSAIKDRVVLIGMAFDGIDQWPTPIYGNMPGVFIHAVALETLLNYGPDHPEKPDEYIMVSSSDIFDILIHAIFIFSVIVAAKKEKLIVGAAGFFALTIAMPYIYFFMGYMIPSITSINVTEQMVFTTTLAITLAMKSIPALDEADS
ncbi:hypothetical protein M2352_002575 [Azospirillum fermentarium]|uniref:CHASE2 domain-containing protein n=1 Tax=Azospirillum fermentarium TaxID=1233114 RepID=UPI0022278E15|nr:CHASE2 domain-containing protein [Azospirillum fermentarium]MCW2246984.1 hypothetical protein [Azospirillum fermentarium]